MSETEKLKAEIKVLLSIVEGQKELMTQSQSLLKEVMDNVKNNHIRIDCLILDYSIVASSFQAIRPNEVIARLNACTGMEGRQS